MTLIYGFATESSVLREKSLIFSYFLFSVSMHVQRIVGYVFGSVAKLLQYFIIIAMAKGSFSFCLHSSAFCVVFFRQFFH